MSVKLALGDNVARAVAPCRSAARRDLVASRITSSDATLWGPDAEAEAGDSPRLGRGRLRLAPARRRCRRPARRSARAGRRPHRAVRHGRLLARPRGHHAHVWGRAHRARLDRPRPGARRARRASPDDDGGRDLVQVRLDRRDGQPQADLRGALPSCGHRPARPHRRRDRSGLAARRVGSRRRLPRVQRRPERRRTLLGADRLRPRPVGARRRRPRRAARRGGDDVARARDRLSGQRRARARRRDGAPQGQARDRAGRHPHRRLRRLGRAAHRRVHRQASARACCLSCSTLAPPRSLRRHRISRSSASSRTGRTPATSRPTRSRSPARSAPSC